MNETKKKLYLASPRGFCAGVDRAIRIVDVALEKFGPPIYVRHEIVHNKRVVNDLSLKGAIFVNELDQVPSGFPVILSAHGVSQSVHKEAKRLNMITIDATCPLVSKVHIETKKHEKKGHHILFIGHSGHPEVVGTLGQVSSNSITLIENEDDAKNFVPKDDNINLAYATQTTLSSDDTEAIIKILRDRFPSIAGPNGNDICYATTNRQNAVKSIASKTDYFIVIGSENSSNSKRLVEVALKAGAKRARLIENFKDLNFEEIDKAKNIGLSAGASAPEFLVDEVRIELEKRYKIKTDFGEIISEDLHFKLPSILN